MKRLPIVLSTTALLVALFGSTPVGHAVGSKVPFFAKTAGYANRAGTAAKLSGIGASKQPRPGMLLPLGVDGKFPASVGAIGPVGPQGPKGDKGDKGDKGLKGETGAAGPVGARGPSGMGGWEYLTNGRSIPSKSARDVAVSCPTGKRAVGGGVAVSGLGPQHKARVIQSAPGGAAATGWIATIANDEDTAIGAYAWVICANIS